MSQGLPVRLRVMVPAVENAIDGGAFRPGDVLVSRSGKTSEIGNTGERAFRVYLSYTFLKQSVTFVLDVSVSLPCGAAVFPNFFFALFLV